MSEFVYLFGAGINRGLSDSDGLKPPLATDFFKQLLQSVKYSSEAYLNEISDLLLYINTYWKLKKDDLLIKEFDLENCFTLIQLQKEDAKIDRDKKKFLYLSKIETQLTLLLAEFLDDMSHVTHSSDSFIKLGKILFSQQPTILTFNYDTLLEQTIEHASGLRDKKPNSILFPEDNTDPSDNELPYSHYKWSRPLSYGIKFNEIQLHRPGLPEYVSDDQFYSYPENKLYDWSLLKLHGSLNWYEYSGVPEYQIPGMDFVSKEGKLILCNPSYWFNRTPTINNEILEPLIITPVLYKRLRHIEAIYSTWKKAKEKLSNCKNLVIGGYSFPPTDFHTKRLFYESFKDHTPKNIIIINPDTKIIKTVKDLCHFSKSVLDFKNLDEYVNYLK